MSRVISNATSLLVTPETALETPGTIWDIVPRTDIGRWGAELRSESSTPISRNRRRQSSVIVDLDSGVEFSDALRLSTLRRFLPGFMFATPTIIGDQGASYFKTTAAVDGAGSEDSFTVAAEGDIANGFLIYARGFATAANNGLFVTTGTSTGTAIKVATGTLVAETAPNNATVEIAGIQGATGDYEIDSSGDLICTAGDFTTTGIEVGQHIWIGGDTAGTSFAEAVNRGLARADVVAAKKITLSHKTSTFTTDDGASKTIQVFFGEFLRDVDQDHADFLEQSYQFEVGYPNLGAGGAAMYEYAKGNYCNALNVGMGLTGIVSAGYGFIGTDTPIPVVAGSRLSGASTPLEQTQRQVFSTAINFMRLRMIDIDESGLTTDFKNVSIVLNNNIVPEKVLATLGARYMNYGEFGFDIDSTLIFSEPDVATRMRENTLIGFDFVLRNDDGGMHVQTPSARLGSGMRGFPVNESVTMQTTIMAEEDATLGYSVAVSLFPYLPAS
jgi:hypothetical protein